MSGNTPFFTFIVAQKHSHHMEAFSQPASKCYTYDPEMSVYRVQLVSSVIEIEVIIGFFLSQIVVIVGTEIVWLVELRVV